jgi:hypothetical protein
VEYVAIGKRPYSAGGYSPVKYIANMANDHTLRVLIFHGVCQLQEDPSHCCMLFQSPAKWIFTGVLTRR